MGEAILPEIGSIENGCTARRPPVALIAGPTASGKSAIALHLAEARNGVVINADASQVYADLRVLSARPDDDALRRAPHTLFGHIDGATAYSAADWAREATAAIADAHAMGRLPILTGGTGLYLRTLLDGIAPVPPITQSVRDAVRAMPVAEAHAALMREDPEAAERLNPRDSTRVARALEVVRSTGQPLHVWQASKSGGIGSTITLHPALLMPDRDWLNQRCADRLDAMLAAGALAEVEALLARNLPPALPVMRAIGVPPIAAFLRGEMDEAGMRTQTIIDTRRYAKRQYTWFRHQPPADWSRLNQTDYDRWLNEIEIKLRQ